MIERRAFLRAAGVAFLAAPLDAAAQPAGGTYRIGFLGGGSAAGYGFREYCEAGGLLAYGVDLPHIWRQAGVLVDKILKGAKPADLPIQQATRFELVLNARTAKALALTIPPELLARTDQVIGN